MVSVAKYVKLINLHKDNEEKLNELLIKIRSDATLSESDRFELQKVLYENENDYEDNEDNESIGKSFQNKYYYKDLYNISDEDSLPSYKTLFDGEDYNYFLNNVLFDRFFYIPDLEIQKPILSALCFLNSLVVPTNTALPLFYFLSNKPNSGKSTFARFVSYHYPAEYRLYLAEDTTGGGLRNSINHINKDKQPIIVILDNFHPTLTVQRLGAFYGRLLKYTKAESLVSNAEQNGKGIITFNTHGLKIFTSIFPLDRRTIELKSRCFLAYFEPSIEPLDSLDNYNWSELPGEYHKLWGNIEIVNKEFSSIFRSANKAAPSNIINRQWQLSKYLLATAVYAGIFDSLDQGINHLTEYWQWVDKFNDIKSASPIEMAIRDYVNNIHPKEVEREFKRLKGLDCELDINIIEIDAIYSYLEGSIQIKRSVKYDNDITAIMTELGWKISLGRNRSGKAISIQFVRE